MESSLVLGACRDHRKQSYIYCIETPLAGMANSNKHQQQTYCTIVTINGLCEQKSKIEIIIIAYYIVSIFYSTF